MNTANDRAGLARRALLDTLRVANLLDRKGGALARTAGITLVPISSMERIRSSCLRSASCMTETRRSAPAAW